jgi:dUTP pyrophosphatase
MRVELQIIDPRLAGWGFPSWRSRLAAGLDLHACLEGPLALQPQSPAVLVSAGFSMRIRDPEWCGLILPRSGLGHHDGLILGNSIGLIDADYEGPCLLSLWNRNSPVSGRKITIQPGDRIAQLVFTRIARPEFAIVSSPSEDAHANGGGADDDRGPSGFGSTGVAAACSGAPTGRNSSPTS